jgi:hypothetical protein
MNAPSETRSTASRAPVPPSAICRQAVMNRSERTRSLHGACWPAWSPATWPRPRRTSPPPGGPARPAFPHTPGAGPAPPGPAPPPPPGAAPPPPAPPPHHLIGKEGSCFATSAPTGAATAGTRRDGRRGARAQPRAGIRRLSDWRPPYTTGAGAHRSRRASWASHIAARPNACSSIPGRGVVPARSWSRG